MKPPDLFAALAPVAAALERLGVAYYLGGSVASSAHGFARATLDADLVADLEPEHVEPLVEALSEGYYLDRDAVMEAVGTKGSFNLVHLETMLKVDVFLMKGSPYDREAARRVRRETLDEGDACPPIPLASPEDVVLHKLLWYRKGGGVSDRQWGDAVGILKVQADRLDLDYLRRWAAVLELTALLDRALADAGIG